MINGIVVEKRSRRKYPWKPNLLSQSFYTKRITLPNRYYSFKDLYLNRNPFNFLVGFTLKSYFRNYSV